MRPNVFIQKPTNWYAIAAKLLALAVLIAATNFGFLDRIKLLVSGERWFTLIFYLGVWAVSVGAVIIAAFQPKKIVRLAWAGLLSVSTAIAFMYTSISGSELSVFDALSLWTAKHEAHRAFEFYRDGALWSALVFLVSFVIIATPPVPNHRWVRFGLKWLSWTPAVPVLLLAAIILIKEGGGSQAMPSQFQPLAVGMVTTFKTATHKRHVRQNVTLVTRQPPAVKNIIMLIDESVRPDYLNWKIDNPFTPHLAANKSRIVNFGSSVSGGNCSSYSNAILRLGGTSDNLVKSVLSNPTIWQYAKQAGFRTVYIDGQSGLNKDPGLLQNFMTVGEIKNIDRIVRFNNVAGPQLDYKLLEAIKKELASDQPVFIYANKNGAHFPYDEGYPVKHAQFSPTITQAGQDRLDTRINSYLNVISWSVDKFFAKLFSSLDLSRTVLIYTSDHGQALANGKLTHCTVNGPDPREALVPLFVLTGKPGLKTAFAKGALLNNESTSHFSIRPTVLALMGYKKSEVEKKYGASLFKANLQQTRFSSGDIFGVFRNKVRWTKIDLHKNYFEGQAAVRQDPGPVANIQN